MVDFSILESGNPVYFNINETGVPVSLTLANGAYSLNGLNDVYLTEPVSGYALVYDGSRWIASGFDAVAVDHSSLTNLQWNDAGHTFGSGQGNLDLNYNGASGIEFLDFITTGEMDSIAGRLTWNDGDGTLNLGMKGGTVNQQIGQEIFLPRSKAQVDILNGQIVYISGADGSNTIVSLADCSDSARAHATIALATEDVSQGNYGFFTTNGLVRRINTSAYSVGQALYLGLNGNFTGTSPAYPYHSIEIGKVVQSHANQGQIYVKINPGTDLDTLHDTSISNVKSGQILSYNGSIWVNSSNANLGSLTFSGSFVGTTNYISSSPYTVGSDYIMLADDDAAGGIILLDFPTNPQTGSIFNVKKLGSTANVVLSGSNVTFDGEATFSLTLQYEAATVVSYGSGYYII